MKADLSRASSSPVQMIACCRDRVFVAINSNTGQPDLLSARTRLLGSQCRYSMTPKPRHSEFARYTLLRTSFGQGQSGTRRQVGRRPHPPHPPVLRRRHISCKHLRQASCTTNGSNHSLDRICSQLFNAENCSCQQTACMVECAHVAPQRPLLQRNGIGVRCCQPP